MIVLIKRIIEEAKGKNAEFEIAQRKNVAWSKIGWLGAIAAVNWNNC